MEMPARGDAALSAAIRLASAPTTRCCAAVGGSAALRMRHTPCGCRSAYLAQVQPNHYLPIVPTNAASAAMLPWQAPASPITSEVDGNCVRPTNRRQSGSEDRSKSNRLDTKNSRHSIPQAAQLFKRPTANAGIEGDSPRLSLGGSKGGILFGKRIPPFIRAPARCRDLPPCMVQEKPYFSS